MICNNLFSCYDYIQKSILAFYPCYKYMCFRLKSRPVPLVVSEIMSDYEVFLLCSILSKSIIICYERPCQYITSWTCQIMNSYCCPVCCFRYVKSYCQHSWIRNNLDIKIYLFWIKIVDKVRNCLHNKIITCCGCIIGSPYLIF